MKGKHPSLREAASAFVPYIPGRGVEEIKREHGIGDAVKLSSNENLWGSSPYARFEVEKELENMHIYPSPVAGRLRKVLAEKDLTDTENIIIGNGTDEIIEILAKTFLEPSDALLCAENSFMRYRMAAMLMGSECIQVPREDFKVSAGEICRKVDKSTKLIFIDNPSNPSGTYIKPGSIEQIIGHMEKINSRALLVVDEAYYEYARQEDGYESALKYVRKGKQVMVLRTFSKAYGLAGLRVGYGVAPEPVISSLMRVKPPFNVNCLAQAAAVGALKDSRFISETVKQTLREKEFLYGEFEKLGLEFVFSAANFILVKVGQKDAGPVSSHLEKRGVIVRPLKGYLYPDYLRITVGKRPHNIRLLKALGEYLGNMD